MRRGDKEEGIELACSAWGSGLVRQQDVKYPSPAPQAAVGDPACQPSQNQSPNMYSGKLIAACTIGHRCLLVGLP